VDRSHEHPPGSATAGSGNLWGKAQYPIALIGPNASPPCRGVFMTSVHPLPYINQIHRPREADGGRPNILPTPTCWNSRATRNRWNGISTVPLPGRWLWQVVHTQGAFDSSRAQSQLGQSSDMPRLSSEVQSKVHHCNSI